MGCVNSVPPANRRIARDGHEFWHPTGLIVTTSSFSPAAREVCTARGYDVAEADRGTLRTWLEAMRTPGAGVFLGE